MDQRTGKAVTVNGKSVTSSADFTPDTVDGETTVDFHFNTKGLDDTTVVVFEKMFYGKAEIAAHEDINDKGQTIYIPSVKENSNYKCDRVYSYFENNELKFGKKEALTITESDQLEYIEQLINDFPEITFHIAASTIMSDKLTRLDINNNVELYPCITEQKRKELFERCDIYLDINHYRELYNAVNEAMVNNMIILAFDNTAHSKELYPMGNIFESSNYVKMKETLKNIITSQTIFNEYIDRQKKQLKQLAAKVVMGDTDESI